jgi:type I restriction enzyme, R subunit
LEGFELPTLGIDRTAVSEAFSGFLAGGTASAAQIEFIDMAIEQLTDQGMMDLSLLYEPPFTGVALTGPEHLFDAANFVRLVSRIREVNGIPPLKAALFDERDRCRS